MRPVNTRQVGQAFQNGEDARGHGSIRCETRGPLTIGYSYSQPVAIHDGERTLRTIDQWSVTTSGHVSSFGVVGKAVPSIGTYLRACENGGAVAFGMALAHGERALRKASERVAAKGVPCENVEPGVYVPTWGYRTVEARIVKGDGDRWYVSREDVIVSDHRTLREAKCALWSVLGVTPSASLWDVKHSDFD